MNIALMAHDNKKDLMVQFCTAYAGILSKHTICATNITGKMVAEATGLPIHLFLARVHGGAEQIGARIAYNEIDMVLFFNDPRERELYFPPVRPEQHSLCQQCGDGGNARPRPQPRRPRLARHREPENQAVYGVILNTNRIISA